MNIQLKAHHTVLAPPGRDAVPRVWPNGRLAMAKVVQMRDELSVIVANLADDLVQARSGWLDPVAALDRVRRRVGAVEALVWMCDGARARRVLHAGIASSRGPGLALELEDGAATIQRLRQTGTVFRRAGEVSGLEQFVPPGVESFIAAASIGADTITGVLVIGWSDPEPPYTAAEAAPLRTAAALLAVTASRPTPARMSVALADAIVDSLPDSIAVINPKGTIVAVNAAWAKSAGRLWNSIDAPPTPGANYFDAYRRSAGNTGTDASDVIEAITAVCTGNSEGFETAYAHTVLGEERFTAISATPLRHNYAGAVITHSDVTRNKVAELATGLGQSQFERLADDLPIPIVIVTTEGQVLHGNQSWLEASGERGNPPRRQIEWTSGMSAGTRVAAKAALRTAAERGERFRVDLRLKGIDGLYRWWMCIGVPRRTPDGGRASYVCTCHDVTAARRVQSTLGDIATKLLAAEGAERGRIARELHDDVGQQVAVLASQLELVTATASTKGTLVEARRRLQDIAATLSGVSHRLHPGKLRLLGLVRTLDGLCRDVARKSAVQVEFTAKAIPSNLADETTVSVFRVAQEALRNAIRHGNATRVDVQIAGDDTWLTLSVTDDGVGFDAFASHPAGLGLLTMRERIELVGGHLTITPRTPHGTSIEATVPTRVRRGGARRRPRTGGFGWDTAESDDAGATRREIRDERSVPRRTAARS